MNFLKFVFIIFFQLLIFNQVYSFTDQGKGAQSTGREDTSFLEVKSSNIENGEIAFKQAQKYRAKNTLKKSNKRLNDALNYFLAGYKEDPKNVSVLNYLGIINNILGDQMMSEIYYQLGLSLGPNNPILNQNLGNLYLDTKRISLAEERLSILMKCNCDEYNILKKNIIKSGLSEN